MPCLLREILQKAQKTLINAQIDNAPLDARLLIGYALELSRADLLAQSERVLSDDEETKIDAVIQRRAAREPVSRILGEREFWGLPFYLNEATLDPRPDSETLIEVALKICVPTPDRILDLGTGTGCLLLALLHDFQFATGLGVDLAPKAVEQATLNAQKLILAERASFVQSDWFSNVTGTFDLIVSNPPYIPCADLPSLMPEVRLFDPPRALDGGSDGLDPYRMLIPRLPSFLNDQGKVIFEVGIDQARDVAALLDQAGLTNILITKDLGGIERCVSARKSA